MIQVSYPPFGALERGILAERMAGRGRGSRGCVGAFAYYGWYLILIPIIVGGAFGLLLAVLGLHRVVSLAIGAFVGLGCGGFFLHRSLHRERLFWSRVSDQLRDDLNAGHTELMIVSEICGAWYVRDLEDFGPGYVLETSRGEWIYVCSQELPDVLDDDFPKDTIEIKLFPASKEVYAVCPKGQVVPRNGAISVAQLPVDILCGCQILARANPDYLAELLRQCEEKGSGPF